MPQIYDMGPTAVLTLSRIREENIKLSHRNAGCEGMNCVGLDTLVAGFCPHNNKRQVSIASNFLTSAVILGVGTEILNHGDGYPFVAIGHLTSSAVVLPARPNDRSTTLSIKTFYFARE